MTPERVLARVLWSITGEARRKGGGTTLLILMAGSTQSLVLTSGHLFFFLSFSTCASFWTIHFVVPANKSKKASIGPAVAAYFLGAYRAGTYPQET
jgi:hypothetical protein